MKILKWKERKQVSIEHLKLKHESHRSQYPQLHHQQHQDFPKISYVFQENKSH